jgi:WhiB family transcriptional regulator, redox-sensing transcriptional regulator
MGCCGQDVPMTLLAIETGERRLTWVARAQCRSADPDELFVSGAAQRRAVEICRHCPVLADCLADALDNRIEFGVWGGMTERARRKLIRQHPEVTSWSEFIATRRHDGHTMRA